MKSHPAEAERTKSATVASETVVMSPHISPEWPCFFWTCRANSSTSEEASAAMVKGNPSHAHLPPLMPAKSSISKILAPCVEAGPGKADPPERTPAFGPATYLWSWAPWVAEEHDFPLGFFAEQACLKGQFCLEQPPGLLKKVQKVSPLPEPPLAWPLSLSTKEFESHFWTLPHLPLPPPEGPPFEGLRMG